MSRVAHTINKHTVTIIIALIIALVAMGGIVFYYSSLTVEVPIPPDEEPALRVYADPMTENMLNGIKNANLALFSSDFDTAMKNAFTQSEFDKLLALLGSKVGSYVSKEFLAGTRFGSYTIAYYNASFTNEPSGVTVKVVFASAGGPAQITGLWFNSPKLRS